MTSCESFFVFKYLPCSVASASIVVYSVDADSTIHAWSGGTIVEVKLAIFSNPSRNAVAVITAICMGNTGALIFAGIFLTAVRTERKFALFAGEILLTGTHVIAILSFGASSAILA